ncbi:MAG TPA: capsule assembly Wzi family protein [Bacteroidales bacterium]|nr:capsule assembly Wzi family protein [Bacteroidales bacterium]
MKSILQYISFILILFLICSKSQSQNFSPYFTLQRHNKYIEYLINSGQLDVDHPLNQPYTSDEILKNLPAENKTFNDHWLKLVKKDLERLASINDTLSNNGKFISGLAVGDKYIMNETDSSNYLFGNLFFGYEYKNFGIVYKHDFDEAYANDTAYFVGTGKLTDDVLGRASEAYLQWNLKNFGFFVGRLGRNFGINNEPGLLLSNNPFSYDHLALKFSNRVLNFTFLLTRMNDLYGYDIRDSVPVYSWNRRFLSVHRFEISLLQNLEIAFSESILFGGQDQSIRFQYINPANIVFFSKITDRNSYEEQKANAFMSFEVFYKPINKITLFSQLLIDDIDFKKDLREQYPDRLGLTGKMVYSDLLRVSQIYLVYNRISNWTYNSFYNWANYTYYGASLGFPNNGFEKITLGADIFRLAPFIFNVEFNAQRQRAQDLSSPFIAEKTEFPIGIAENRYMGSFSTTWFPRTNFSVNVKFEYAQYQNFQNIENNSAEFFNVYLSAIINGIFDFEINDEKTKN